MSSFDPTAMWDTSCLDWEQRLRDGRSLVPDLPLFTDQAERGLRIFKRLKVPDMIGTPRLGEVCSPWFFDIVSAVFGCFNSEENMRMLQDFFLLIPKKNGKSSYGGPLMLTAAIFNERPEAEFVFIAPTLSIANIAFKQVAGTIRLDPALDDVYQIRTHIRTIESRNDGTTLQIKAADTDVITGGKQVATMIDESHELLAKGNADAIMTELRGALTARPEGFVFQTTTQSKKPPVGAFANELIMAREVRDGKQKARFLPILYEFPKSMMDSGDWKKSAFWHIVNPNYGKSVNPQFLAEQWEKNERQGVAQFAMFLSQHFNIEIGLGFKTNGWVGAEFWEQSENEEITFDYMLENCEVLVVGIDGGGMDDLLGVGFTGRHKVTKHWLHWSKSWCHNIVFERRKSIAAELSDFQKSGDLIVVDDLLQSMDDIVGLIEQANAKGILVEVAADSMGPFGSFVEALSLIGITQESDGAKLIGVAQGIAMMGAIKTSENKLANGTMWHSKDKCMSWCVSNIKIEPTATAIRATKQNAGDAKIDTAMAMFDCVMRLVLNPEAPGGSYLDDEELMVF